MRDRDDKMMWGIRYISKKKILIMMMVIIKIIKRDINIYYVKKIRWGIKYKIYKKKEM